MNWRVCLLESQILNLGCGDDPYGTHRVDIFKTKTTTHVFDVEMGLQFSDNTFDVVYSKNLLEHLRNVGFHLGECLRVLKPGGSLDVTTDNAECVRYYVYGTHTGRYEKNHPGDHHYCIFTAKHLMNHLEAAGFKMIDVRYEKTDTVGKYVDAVTLAHPRLRGRAIK
jgi:predicted SAM-dependent methyltransferase